MKDSILKCVLLSSAIFLSAHAVSADEWTGHINGFQGAKLMDNKDWPKLDNAIGIGSTFDLQKQGWPVSLSVDTFAASDNYKRGTLEDTGSSFEVHAGVRKIFNQSGTIQPFIGGGVAFIAADWEQESGTTTTSEDDRAFGGWAGVGMYVEISEHFNVGVDMRYSKADVTIFDQKRDAGGFLVGMTAGYHF